MAISWLAILLQGIQSSDQGIRRLRQCVVRHGLQRRRRKCRRAIVDCLSVHHCVERSTPVRSGIDVEAHGSKSRCNILNSTSMMGPSNIQATPSPRTARPVPIAPLTAANIVVHWFKINCHFLRFSAVQYRRILAVRERRVEFSNPCSRRHSRKSGRRLNSAITRSVRGLFIHSVDDSYPNNQFY